MITAKYSIEGFKCFLKSDFELKKITVLTGANGSGKSSVIQSMLLLRLGIERNLGSHELSDFTGNTWVGKETPLNLGYKLNLGTYFDIFNNTGLVDNKIKLALNDELFEISFPEKENNQNSVYLKLVEANYDSRNIPFWRKHHFYYLNAERIGPRYNNSINYTEYPHCGYSGEYTAQVILDNPFYKVDLKRLYKGAEDTSDRLPLQIDSWIDFICPGTSVKPKYLGELVAQIRLRNQGSNADVLSTNIGFGITYALPIITTGLIAESGCMFIVENPEAHLHPKAQSNIGYFLGRIAASGVHIIVETHSEHVINGIRRAILEAEDSTHEDISIYFFDGFDTNKMIKITKVSVDREGELTPFPRDFFDQLQQDMAAIFRIRKSK